MPEVATFSEAEQKYFDTRGTAALPPEETPEVEPAPAEPEKPAPVEQEGGDDRADVDNPGKFVRHGAFHEERQRRKEVEAQLASYRERSAAEQARLEERLNLIANSFRQPEAAPDPMQRLNAIEERVLEREQSEEQQRQQYAMQRQFVDTVEGMEQEFAGVNKDYYDAINFGKQARLDDLKALGFEGKEAEAVLQNDVVNLTQDALRRGISPAERFYNYAKARGWGKPAAPPATLVAAGSGKIRSIAAGQQAGKSLGSAPGATEPTLTLQALADMSQDEFDKIDAKTWKKMMGG